MTEEEFDQTVPGVADSYPVGDIPCDSKRGYNSNTFADDVIEGAGGVMPDADGVTQ
ncbi:hypothetical protein S1OALGB6SA_838 [Olavius algarvensis spirochete endosymbiont]|nr:MAG: hypothetical protein [Olavius algarvensis spirochete endosymbiont]VDA99765.1 hypothetical protein S1OALGB6SA_838 [Olavius algarvensis spirochete endosymbiont]